MIYSKISSKDVANHYEYRFGYGLLAFNETVNYFKDKQYPAFKLGKLISLEYGKALKEEDRNEDEFPVVGSNGIVGYHDE
jgi:hypothetical protein